VVEDSSYSLAVLAAMMGRFSTNAPWSEATTDLLSGSDTSESPSVYWDVE
jgi:hypothetical protein